MDFEMLKKKSRVVKDGVRIRKDGIYLLNKVIETCLEQKKLKDFIYQSADVGFSKKAPAAMLIKFHSKTDAGEFKVKSGADSQGRQIYTAQIAQKCKPGVYEYTWTKSDELIVHLDKAAK